MKKIFLVLALVASMQVFDAQAQVKSPSAAKSAVEKAEAATTNPKQSQKPATWIKYGKALLDAYDAPAGNLWVGMSRQELQVLGGSDKPLSESVAELGGRQMTKVVFENKNLYFNENGLLEVIEVTQPVVEGALDKALSAYVEAAKLDPANKKKKDISAGLTDLAGKYASDAYNAYAFGKMGEASISFEKAAAASALLSARLTPTPSTTQVSQPRLPVTMPVPRSSTPSAFLSAITERTAIPTPRWLMSATSSETRRLRRTILRKASRLILRARASSSASSTTM